ncbi:MAG TPA: hypothetical protein VLG44_07080 [Chlamydiales bacterium]|nr:hypothetical protein [Chlamydiales bacterium]
MAVVIADIRARLATETYLSEDESQMINVQLQSIIDDGRDHDAIVAAVDLQARLQLLNTPVDHDLPPVGDGRDVQHLPNGNGDEKSPPAAASERREDDGFGLGLSATATAAAATNGHSGTPEHKERKEYKGEEVGDAGYDPLAHVDHASRELIRSMQQEDSRRGQPDDELDRLLASGRAELASSRAQRDEEADIDAATRASLGLDGKDHEGEFLGLTSESGSSSRPFNFEDLKIPSPDAELDWLSLGFEPKVSTMQRFYEIAAIGKKFFLNLPKKRIAIAGGLLTGAGWWMGGATCYGLIFGLAATMSAVRTIRKFCPPKKKD